MNLKTKMMSLSLLPMVLIGIILFVVAAGRIENGVYKEAYVGMYATSLAIRDIFEVGHEGKYWMDDNGELWKGEEFNISQATDIVDHIKNNTGLEVTIFWKDTRILTSIVDRQGSRQIGTKTSETIVDKVIKKGETYQNRNVDIMGKEYVVFYVPFFQEGTEEAVGMVFLGTPQDKVYDIIENAKRQLLPVIFLGIAFTAVFVYFLVRKIVYALEHNMQLLDQISKGSLKVHVEERIIHRKDEIGKLGRNIAALQDRLRSIVEGIKYKSHDFRQESEKLKNISQEAYQIMKDVDCAAQEMAKSCMSQAEGAFHASENVTEMGEMIKENGLEVMRINEIAGNMKEVSQGASTEIKEMNKVMGDVKESIHFLMEQTKLTENSVNQISAATEVIDAIASKTKLLSFNASIEAARVGENGNGFAVVAYEIQQLSEQSNAAAARIQTIVDELNMNTSHTLDRVEDMRCVIDIQEGNIKKTNHSFKEVYSGIDGTVNGIKDILEKAEKLEEVRMDTVAIVQNAAAVSQENSASIQEIMASIESMYQDIEKVSNNARVLNELSQEMQEKVDIFVL